MRINLILLASVFSFFPCKSIKNDREFSGKIALVTGASTGIGFSTAMALAREGATVIIVSRDSTPDCYTRGQAENQINMDKEVIIAEGKAKFFKADVSKIDQMRSLFEKIEKDFGSIDIAVNNAGIGGFSAKIEDIPDEISFTEHDPIMNNLYGVYNSLKVEIKHFKKFNKVGSIINLSSYNGIRSCPGCSNYSASKFGIIGLTKSVAMENLDSPYIRVNAVAPGLVDTYLTRNQVISLIDPSKQPWEGKCISKDDMLWKKYKPEFLKDIPSGRILEPEDIANMIIYLASEKSSALTGAVLPGDFGASSK